MNGDHTGDTEERSIEQFIEERFDAPDDVKEELEVQHTKQSARFRLNLKRGTGTRDQEEATVEVSAASLYDLAPQVEPARELAFEQMRRTRAFDPPTPTEGSPDDDS